GVALVLGVLDALGGLVPAEGFFLEHGMVRLIGVVPALLFAQRAIFAIIVEFLGIELLLRILPIGYGLLDMAGLIGGGGVVVVVQAAHAGFLFVLGALVAGCGIGRFIVGLVGLLHESSFALCRVAHRCPAGSAKS